MKKIFDGFALAVSMLSILPFFKVHHFYKGINGYSVMFYPLVGLMLGMILYLSYTFLGTVMPEEHTRVLVFSLWVIVTGALHLDGLSDTIDGLFVPKEKALQVMKDSHVGGMGMVFTSVFLLVKLSSLLAISHLFLIIPIMMLSRFGAVFIIYNYPYVHKNGMGALAKEELTLTHYILTVLYVSVITFYLHVGLLFFVTLCGAYCLSRCFLQRYGGLSGDMYGFSIEILELLLLNCVVIGML
jgi:cobalamin 5'-phosphate synthase/cobalamin synthase